MTGPAVEDLLRLSEHIIEGHHPRDVSWERVSALLARMALEKAIDELWLVHEPVMERQPMRTQLVCLGSVLPPSVAADVALAWWLLSRACHHLAYELPPGEDDLRRAIEIVRRLVETIAVVTSPTPRTDH